MADEPTHVEGVEARAGATPGVMRYVLGISLALIIAMFAIVLFVWR